MYRVCEYKMFSYLSRSLSLAILLLCLGLQPSFGETRSLWIHTVNTKETDRVIYKRDGQYLKSGLRRLDYLVRDFRRNETVEMDPELYDLLWRVYQKSGSRQPIHVVSGYRSKHTNDLLRRKGHRVARNSQHMHGKAIDFYLPDVPIQRLQVLGLREHKGGVGYYRGSFVHLDTGSVRHWPMMSQRQLSRVFPEGRTVHLARGKRKLKGYEVAQQNLEKGLFYDGRQDIDNNPETWFTRLVGGASDPVFDDGDTAIAANTQSPSRSSISLASLAYVATPVRRSVYDAVIASDNVIVPDGIILPNRDILGDHLASLPMVAPPVVLESPFAPVAHPVVPAIRRSTRPTYKPVFIRLSSHDLGLRPAPVELKLGNLTGEGVKAWALSTSTRVGSTVSITLPRFATNLMSDLPTTIQDQGFSNQETFLRSDRFSGRALTNIAIRSNTSDTDS